MQYIPFEQIWLDTTQGTLISGLPAGYVDPKLMYSMYSSIGFVFDFPSSIELLLKEDVSFRFLSRLPICKEIDTDAIQTIHWTSTSIPCKQYPAPPHVRSRKTGSVIVVGNVEWKEGPYLDNHIFETPVAMPDGTTRWGESCSKISNSDFWALVISPRFTLCPNHGRSTRLCIDFFDFTGQWLSQALSLFHQLGMSPMEGPSDYGESYHISK